MTYTEKNLQGEQIVLVKPESFMNQSGPALREFLEAQGALPSACRAEGDREESLEGESWAAGEEPLGDRLLVVHDDLDLPFGKIRFKARGSSGGHRGVDSLLEALGADSFSRLKVGIGREEGAEASEYVLEPLSGRQRDELLEAAAHAGRTLRVWIHEGVQACAHKFNGPRGEMARDA